MIITDVRYIIIDLLPIIIMVMPMVTTIIRITGHMDTIAHRITMQRLNGKEIG